MEHLRFGVNALLHENGDLAILCCYIAARKILLAAIRALLLA